MSVSAARTLARVRAFISGVTLLILGILLIVVLGPQLHAGEDEPDRAASVANTSPATTSGSTGAPTPSVTGVLTPSTTGVLTTPTDESPTPAAASPTPVTHAPTSAAPGAVPNFDPSLPVTVGFGDSITVYPKSWFRQVCAAGVVLHNCLNAGIRGNTTTQMLARLDSDVLSYQPTIVTVMGGTNDLQHRESTKSIVHRLDLIIERVRASGAKTVLCTVPPRDGYGKQVLALNVAIRQYAARNDVPLLDFYSLLGTKTGVYKRGLTADGIHPNLRAENLMTARARQQLPALLDPSQESP